MPYIVQERRQELDLKLKELFNENLTVGELNYVISRILKNLVEQKKHIKQFSYQFCNDIIGVLECAKIEFYTRVVTPYEDLKRKENGDLYVNLF